LIELNFRYLDVTNIQTIKMQVITWNDYLSLSNGVSSILELLNGGNKLTLTKEAGRGNKIQGLYYLPSSQLNIKWVGLDLNGNQVKSGTIPSSALIAGQNKIITIDTTTGLTTTQSASTKLVGQKEKESFKVQVK
jgi:hypothetical protein